MNARKKSQKTKKDSPPVSLNKKQKGRQFVQQIHVRQASEEEVAKTEHALDRLLRELVSQVCAQRRKS